MQQAGRTITEQAVRQMRRLPRSGRGAAMLLPVMLVSGIVMAMVLAWNMSLREERLRGEARTLSEVLQDEGFGLHHWLHRERTWGLNGKLPLAAGDWHFLDADESSRLADDPAVASWRRRTGTSTVAVMPRGWSLVRMIVRPEAGVVENAVIVLRPPTGLSGANLDPLLQHFDSFIEEEGTQAERLATTAFASDPLDSVADFDPARDRAFMASVFARLHPTAVRRGVHAGHPGQVMVTDVEMQSLGIVNVNQLDSQEGADPATLFGHDCDDAPAGSPVDPGDGLLCQMELRMRAAAGRDILDCLDNGGTLVDEAACHAWLNSSVIGPLDDTFQRKSGHVLNALNAADVCDPLHADHDAERCALIHAEFGDDWWNGFTDGSCASGTHDSAACRAAKLAHVEQLLLDRMIAAAPDVANQLCTSNVHSARCLEWVIHVAGLPTGSLTAEQLANTCVTATTSTPACERVVGVAAATLQDPDMLCANDPTSGTCIAWLVERQTLSSWSPEELCRPLYDPSGSGQLCTAALGSATDPRRHQVHLGPAPLCDIDPDVAEGALPRRACAQGVILNGAMNAADKAACHRVRIGTGTATDRETCHMARMRHLNAWYSSQRSGSAPHFKYTLPTPPTVSARVQGSTHVAKSDHPIGRDASARTAWTNVRNVMNVLPGWPAGDATAQEVESVAVTLEHGLANILTSAGTATPVVGAALVAGDVDVGEGGTLMSFSLVSESGDLWLGPARDTSGRPVFSGDPGHAPLPGIADPDGGPLLNFGEMALAHDGNAMVIDENGNFLTDGTLVNLEAPRTSATTDSEDMSSHSDAGIAVFSGTTSGDGGTSVQNHQMTGGDLNVAACFRSVIPFVYGAGCPQ